MISSIFMAEKSVYCLNRAHFLNQFSAVEHLGLFHILAIVKDVAINIDCKCLSCVKLESFG